MRRADWQLVKHVAEWPAAVIPSLPPPLCKVTISCQSPPPCKVTNICQPPPRPNAKWPSVVIPPPLQRDHKLSAAPSAILHSNHQLSPPSFSKGNISCKPPPLSYKRTISCRAPLLQQSDHQLSAPPPAKGPSAVSPSCKVTISCQPLSLPQSGHQLSARPTKWPSAVPSSSHAVLQNNAWLGNIFGNICVRTWRANYGRVLPNHGVCKIPRSPLFLCLLPSLSCSPEVWHSLKMVISIT